MRKDSCHCFISERSLPASASLTDEQACVGTTLRLRRNGRKGFSFVKKKIPQGRAMAFDMSPPPQSPEQHIKILLKVFNHVSP